MTPWIELRTAVLVGTERRALPAGAVFDVVSEVDLGPERRALHAAALLGAQRRAGRIERRPSTPPSLDTARATGSSETPAPETASQLLELLLGGGLGPASTTAPLLGHWFRCCALAGAVVPHRLLVPVLDGATTMPQLRAVARPVLGQRGAWLGGRREVWSWAAVDETGAGTDELDGAQLLALGSDERVAALGALRRRDPAAGRALLAEVLPHVDAAGRAQLVRCLAEGLHPGDEDLLEGALDDRSKVVRRAAIELLDGLGDSARAARLATTLGPLVERSGRLRPRIAVDYPSAPDRRQQRDLPPGTGERLTTEAAWLRALVAGAPLAWWEGTLGLEPAAIVAGRFEPADDLLAGWTRAAVAERDGAWAEALLRLQPSPELLSIVDAGTAVEVLRRHLDRDLPVAARSRLLAAVDAPWTPELSGVVLRWAKGRENPATALVSDEHLLASALHSDSLPFLRSWLDRVSESDDAPLHRTLRHLVQHLSTRTSISEAFT